MATSRDDFIAALLPAALEVSKRTGIDPRIIVAQAAQETGWGRSAPGNNYFGIKSHGQGGGQNLTTHEVINGQRVKINDSFRQFPSPADSVRGYGDFMMQNSRYRPMREAKGLDAQLTALGQSGYATDPNYASSVGAIARQIPISSSIAAQAPSPPQAPGTPAPPMGAGQTIRDMPIGSMAPSAPPPAVMEAAAPDNTAKLAEMFGSMALPDNKPQFAPAPPVQGPSQAQSTALTSFIQALLQQRMA